MCRPILRDLSPQVNRGHAGSAGTPLLPWTSAPPLPCVAGQAFRELPPSIPRVAAQAFRALPPRRSVPSARRFVPTATLPTSTHGTPGTTGRQREKLCLCTFLASPSLLRCPTATHGTSGRQRAERLTSNARNASSGTAANAAPRRALSNSWRLADHPRKHRQTIPGSSGVPALPAWARPRDRSWEAAIELWRAADALSRCHFGACQKKSQRHARVKLLAQWWWIVCALG